MPNVAIEIPENIDKERFLSMVIVNKGTECWEWLGNKITSGYGRFNFKGKRYYAHRISYFIHKGKLDPYLVIDHMCRNKSCINPDHLREVTTRVNVLENSNSWSATHSVKTHCPKGHEYNEENTALLIKGGRGCRECARISSTHYYYNIAKKRNIEKKLIKPRLLKTHCSHGHEYTSETTYFKKIGRGRMCKVCIIARNKKKLKKLRDIND